MEKNTTDGMDTSSFDNMPTSALKQLLQKDCNGTLCLSIEEILIICEIIVNREKKDRQKPNRTADAAWERYRELFDSWE